MSTLSEDITRLKAAAERCQQAANAPVPDMAPSEWEWFRQEQSTWAALFRTVVLLAEDHASKIEDHQKYLAYFQQQHDDLCDRMVLKHD